MITHLCFKRILTGKFVLLILIYSVSFGIFGQSLNIKTENGSANGSGLATEAGLLARMVYFQRSVGSTSSGFIPVPSFYIGPGAFFDYNLHNLLTISAEIAAVFDVAGETDKSQSFQTGLFAKYWLSDTWGYVGAGSEIFLSNTVSGSTAFKETDIMLTFIITGESVSIKDKFNSTGNLKAGISIYNSLSDKDFRFYFAYVLGIGFNFEKKK